MDDCECKELREKVKRQEKVCRLLNSITIKQRDELAEIKKALEFQGEALLFREVEKEY